jgi:hypothetical protein
MAGQTAGPRGLKFGMVTLMDPGSNIGGVEVKSKVKVMTSSTYGRPQMIISR